MLDLVPRRAFFRFELPVRHLARPMRVDGDVGKWSADYLVPPLVEIEDRRPFADVYWAWSDLGFHAAFDVPNRSALPQCDLTHWYKLDGLRLCIDTRDTRDTRDARRATRFCHFFYLLPVGGGRDKAKPVVGTHRMSRSKEPPPPVDASLIQIAAQVERRRYGLEVLIPAACLTGWDPEDHARIGLFYKIKDTQLGEQHLTCDDDMGWNVDPSTWATGVLVP